MNRQNCQSDPAGYCHYHHSWECNRPYYEGKLTCNSCDAIYDAADDNEAGYCPQCLAEAQADTNPDEAFDLKGQRMERKSDS